jgi:C4-dicarboxylate-specific signal transduction histidine kinase/ActR/RegA family two-component response regulator
MQMPFNNPRHDNVARFHAHQTYFILIVFLLLLSAFIVLLAKQYYISIEHEKNNLLNNFQEHVTQLDHFLSSVTSTVEGLRIHAEWDIMESHTAKALRPPMAFHFLKEEEKKYGETEFHLDDFGAPLTRDLIGNLTGAGPLKDRLPDFYREIYMALNLNPPFRAAFKAIKDAAGIYFTSSRGFVNMYPWVPSKNFKFSFDMFTHEFFQRGNQAYNPTHDLFWTEVYVDTHGKGLMTTCAAPVYDADQFLGTVAIDLTVDFLNTQVRKFHSGKGIMFLINDRSQLLAHPSLITALDRDTKTFQQALPPELRSQIERVSKLSSNHLHKMGRLSILRAELSHAPWQVYYYENQPSILGSLLNHVGIAAIVLLASSISLVFIIYVITFRQFILPSGKMVNFIMARGRGESDHQYGHIPPIWRLWFDTIEETFDQNENLTREIRRQNEELENRVAERTVRLEESNQQLRIKIEERKAAEKEKQSLQDQLQRAQKMEAIGTLAGGVAHDLNNILAGLVSYPQLLLMDLSEDSPLRTPILTIQKSGEKAAAIVQDLLTLARRGVAVSEVLNLNEIARNYLLSPEFGELTRTHSHVEVRTSFADDLLNIVGSPIHISKSIMNLVSNASEAITGNGQVLITTENRHIDAPVMGYDQIAPGDYVVLTVSDTGIGIPGNDLHRIFEPFYTKKAMGRSGTGLGMAVVWSTVKDHGGYIDIQSKPDVGTVLTIYLPATWAKLEEKNAAVNLNLYRGNNENILIVDDVLEQREIGSKILKTLGYKVETVDSGEAALAYMTQHAPDLIVLDMIMDPGMDGLETYQRILDIRPGQKTIIASGYSETDRVREAQKLGAVTYLKKPYLIEKIAMAIRNELDRPA